MKKLHFIPGILAIIALTIISTGAHAQKDNSTFEVGSATVNIGVGVGRSSFGSYGIYSSGYYGYGTGFGTKAAIERGMWQLGPGVLSLGFEAGAAFSNASKSYKSNIIIVAARSAYHFGWNVPNLDTYGGVSLGPGFRSRDYDNSPTDKRTNHDVVIAPGFFVGGSYFFSPKIGVNVEAGYDITVIQGGIVFKLN